MSAEKMHVFVKIIKRKLECSEKQEYILTFSQPDLSFLQTLLVSKTLICLCVNVKKRAHYVIVKLQD